MALFGLSTEQQSPYLLTPMDFRESLKMAVKTLTASKLRSSLTMLGIIIGNASVISMVGLGDGGRRYINEQIQSLGPNVLIIVPGNRETRRLGR